MKLIGNDLFADEGKWLYQDEGDVRLFYTSVTLADPANARYFLECTDEEKRQWEDEHQEPTAE